ncbi:hypothetical protein ACQY0O_006424 [Thecaphora frezii]
MATVPLQAPGPGPTDQALPDYLSYSAVTTRVQPYTETQTRVVYDPQGSFAPYQTVNVVQGTSTAVDYSIVDVPQLYTGPFPAPPLGSLYTTPGQSTPAATSTPASAIGSTSQTATATATASDSQSQSSTAQPTPTPTSASAMSASASSASTVPPSTGSLASASASSSFPLASSTTSAPEPSASVASSPDPRSGLSAGQIAGIVIGSVLGLLLLLLLLLLCLRRRRRQQQEALYTAAAGSGGAGSAGTSGRRSRLTSGFLRNKGRGRYAAVGAGAAAGAGASATAAAGRRGSIDSDEWEEDNLSGSGGSGFFVVGGKRQSSPRRASLTRRRNTGIDPATAYGSGGDGDHGMANVAPSATNGGKASIGSKAGLAGMALGGGLLAAAFGRGKDKGKQRASGGSADMDDDAVGPFSDEEGVEGEMSERRGLMNFREGAGEPEMQEVGGGPSGPWYPDRTQAGAAALGAGALGAHAAHGKRDSQGSSDSYNSSGDRRHQNPSSAGGSGQSGTILAGSRRGSGVYSSSPTSGFGAAGGSIGRGSSGNSAGGITTNGSGNSLPPPPKATRDRGPAQTFGNLPPGGAAIGLGPSYHGEGATAAGGRPRSSLDATSSGASGLGGLNPALLGVGGAAALGGLGALAAGHRESSTSTYSKGFYPSGVLPDMLGSLGDDGRNLEEAGGAIDGGDEKRSHSRPSDPERYSRFISSDTPLLGPGFAGEGGDDDALPPAHNHGGIDEKDAAGSLQDPGHAYPAVAGTLGAASGFQRNRLPTISSVGEFGERSGSESVLNDGTTRSSELRSFNTGSGSHGASSGSAHAARALPVYEERQTMGGETLPVYSTAPEPSDPRPSKAGEAGGDAGFQTPFDSPRTGAAASLFSRDSQRYKPGTAAGRFSTDAGRTTEAESDEPFSDTDRASAGVQRHFSLDQPTNERADLIGGGEGDGHSATAAAAGAGILGGMAAGWRRLTMGQYGWLPGVGERSGDLEDGRASVDSPTRGQGSSAPLLPTNADAQPFSDVRSERATVYNPSALGHGSQGLPVTHLSSREASGESGQHPQRSGQASGSSQSQSARNVGADYIGHGQRSVEPSIGSLSGHSSSQSRRGGYAASVSNSSLSGRRSGSVSTGLDSLSQVVQLSSSGTGSSGSRSGYGSSRRTGGSGRPSEVSLSGASTGAASYSPSGVVNLTRGNTSSTRGGESYVQTSQASYNPSRRSGDASSILTDAADAGWDSSEAQSSRATQGGTTSSERRKRPRSNSEDGPRRLSSLREVGETDPFDDAALPVRTPGGHFPSSTLGNAVIRSAHRQREPTTSAAPQRFIPPSLQPGVSAPAPATVADPSWGSSLAAAEGTGSGWRPSPRVTSVAQRAAEAQARSSMQPRGGSSIDDSAAPAPPSSRAAGAPSSVRSVPRSASHGDLAQRRSALGDVEEGGAEGNPEASAREEQSGSLWPKFLRF